MVAYEVSTLVEVGPVDAVDALVLPAWQFPLNHTIFATDVAGFGDLRRTDTDRGIVRATLYRILHESFAAAGLPWSACIHEDRGDGTLTVAPPNIPSGCLVEPLLAHLAALLREHNHRADAGTRIQLRVAIHVGPVAPDANGLNGQALIHTARMLDARPVKRMLHSTGADLAVITSGHVYDTVVRQTPGAIDPAAYRPVRARVKESTIAGWMYLAGGSQGHGDADHRGAPEMQ